MKYNNDFIMLNTIFYSFNKISIIIIITKVIIIIIIPFSSNHKESKRKLS